MKRGFTLLEVLMAVAILGLGLSVLLGAQTGLFASATRTEHISLATGLARCRMSEVELDLLQKGFPLVDSEGDGPCCMDDSSPDGFTCSWKVERVVLPEMNAEDGGVDGGSPDLNLGNGLDLSSSSTGPLGMLMQLQQNKGAGLGDKPDIGALATQLTSSMGGVDGLASMAMSMVYPTLKPMLEASIRKAIVTVKWQEGIRERTLVVTQYITNPQQGMLDQDGGLIGAAAGMMGTLGGSVDPNTGQPTPAPAPAATSPLGSNLLGAPR